MAVLGTRGCQRDINDPDRVVVPQLPLGVSRGERRSRLSPGAGPGRSRSPVTARKSPVNEPQPPVRIGNVGQGPARPPGSPAPGSAPGLASLRDWRGGTAFPAGAGNGASPSSAKPGSAETPVCRSRNRWGRCCPSLQPGGSRGPPGGSGGTGSEGKDTSNRDEEVAQLGSAGREQLHTALGRGGSGPLAPGAPGPAAPGRSPAPGDGGRRPRTVCVESPEMPRRLSAARYRRPRTGELCCRGAPGPPRAPTPPGLLLSLGRTAAAAPSRVRCCPRRDLNESGGSRRASSPASGPPASALPRAAPRPSGSAAAQPGKRHRTGPHSCLRGQAVDDGGMNLLDQSVIKKEFLLAGGSGWIGPRQRLSVPPGRQKHGAGDSRYWGSRQIPMPARPGTPGREESGPTPGGRRERREGARGGLVARRRAPTARWPPRPRPPRPRRHPGSREYPPCPACSTGCPTAATASGRTSRGCSLRPTAPLGLDPRTRRSALCTSTSSRPGPRSAGSRRCPYPQGQEPLTRTWRTRRSATRPPPTSSRPTSPLRTRRGPPAAAAIAQPGRPTARRRLTAAVFAAAGPRRGAARGAAGRDGTGGRGPGGLGPGVRARPAPMLVHSYPGMVSAGRARGIEGRRRGRPRGPARPGACHVHGVGAGAEERAGDGRRRSGVPRPDARSRGGGRAPAAITGARRARCREPSGPRGSGRRVPGHAPRGAAGTPRPSPPAPAAWCAGPRNPGRSPELSRRDRPRAPLPPSSSVPSPGCSSRSPSGRRCLWRGLLVCPDPRSAVGPWGHACVPVISGRCECVSGCESGRVCACARVDGPQPGHGARGPRGAVTVVSGCLAGILRVARADANIDLLVSALIALLHRMFVADPQEQRSLEKNWFIFD
ncbi:collagen alpha-1(III) chain-like [Corvus cornix cornix]|uniref:collagen alpha-1(III) chain-like n=1 Tax=Corvus cornix cornix TaxID=932674 RepID=UPI00194FB06B|nr:collagen alpha-1(III) chain-like [Corvus cornix cornix]